MKRYNKPETITAQRIYLRAHREKAGISLNQMQELIGLSKSSVSKIERYGESSGQADARGRRRILKSPYTNEVIDAYVAVLKVASWELFLPPDDARREYLNAWMNMDEPARSTLLQFVHDMTAENIAYTIARLRREAQKCFDHADKLEAWGAARSAQTG